MFPPPAGAPAPDLRAVYFDCAHYILLAGLGPVMGGSIRLLV
jgi:hypothetical protein